MAKIHGLVYLIIGAFVSLVSWRVSFENLQLFFYIGLVFVAVGIMKLFISAVKKSTLDEQKPAQPKQQNAAAHQAHMHPQHHPQQHHQNAPVAHHAQHQQHHYKYCPRCRNVVRSHDVFCPRCGARV